MIDAISEKFISGLPADFGQRVRTCYRELELFFEQDGFIQPSAYVGKDVLDWEAGDCAWSLVFLLKGAAHVTAIDSISDGGIATEVMRSDPRFTFVQASIESYCEIGAPENPKRADLIFANTVTEHIQNLPSALAALRQILKPAGLFFNNHDNYYSPCGSHDHGFWAYGDNNYITFQGPTCWNTDEKCLTSATYRDELLTRLPWTWNDEINNRLNPNDCLTCPYYKRSQPWAHLVFAQEFPEVFSSPAFWTGQVNSSLNKLTPFQLMQLISEARLKILKMKRNYINNPLPREIMKLGVSVEDLTTGTFWTLSTVAEEDVSR